MVLLILLPVAADVGKAVIDVIIIVDIVFASAIVVLAIGTVVWPVIVLGFGLGTGAEETAAVQQRLPLARIAAWQNARTQMSHIHTCHTGRFDAGDGAKEQMESEEGMSQ